MQLTRVLQFFKRYQRVNGKLYEGKNRAVPIINAKRKRNMVRHMFREQDNLAILSLGPYLSREEEYGCSKKMIEQGMKETHVHNKRCAQKFQKHGLLSEHWQCLDATKGWE